MMGFLVWVLALCFLGALTFHAMQGGPEDAEAHPLWAYLVGCIMGALLVLSMEYSTHNGTPQDTTTQEEVMK